MAEFRKICHLTSLLDELNTAQEEDVGLVVLAEGNDWMLMEKNSDLLDKYMKESHLTIAKAKNVYNSAKRHGFIDDIKPPYDTMDKFVSVTPDKGRNLIQRRWGIPTGLIRESLGENSKLITITVGVVVALCTVLNIIIAIV